MIESRSEPSLPARRTNSLAGEGVMKLNLRIRGGEANGAWPGQKEITKSKALNPE